MQDVIDDLGRRSTGERDAAGGQLEQHDAEREQIRAVVDRSTERLLRGHVRHRPDDHPGNRDLRLGDARRLGSLGPDELGEAEVEHLDQATFGPHQVRALDVAMHDAARVRFVERVSHLQADLDDLADCERALRDTRRQQLAFHVLHDDEVGAARFADVVGHGDVRRTQERRGPRFVEQARTAVRIRFEVGGKKLQRDRTTESNIFGAIDLAHASGAKALANAIVLNGRTNQ